jgi:hypothetical protein
MNTKGFIGLVVLLITAILAFAGDKMSNFSGDWKLDREKTNLGNAQLFMSKISIKLKNDSLFTVRTYENGNGEQYPFDEKLTLDGKEYKMTIYDMPRKAKAYWSENDQSLVIETTTTFYGNSGEENVVAKEIWKADENGTLLTGDFTIKTSQGESKGTYYFKK